MVSNQMKVVGIFVAIGQLYIMYYNCTENDAFIPAQKILYVDLPQKAALGRSALQGSLNAISLDSAYRCNAYVVCLF
jgi:hypothetical protein